MEVGMNISINQNGSGQEGHAVVHVGYRELRLRATYDRPAQSNANNKPHTQDHRRWRPAPPRWIL